MRHRDPYPLSYQGRAKGTPRKGLKIARLLFIESGYQVATEQKAVRQLLLQILPELGVLGGITKAL